MGLIFAVPGHIDQIKKGLKTESRRLPVEGETCDYMGDKQEFYHVFPANAVDKPVDRVYTASRRIKWGVGQTHAIIPNRGQRAVWVRQMPGELQSTTAPDFPKSLLKLSDSYFRHEGWKQLRVEILRIRYEPVWTITEESAQAEGGYTQLEYIRSWADMYDKPALKMIDSAGNYPDLGLVELAHELLKKRPADKWHCWHLWLKAVKI